MIAEQAAQLTVFQRTANFSMPARNAAARRRERRARSAAGLRASAGGPRTESRTAPRSELPDKSGAGGDRARSGARDVRGALAARRPRPFIGAFNDLMLDQAANDTAAEFVRGKIRAIVRDPAVAELLAARPPDRHQAHLRRYRLLRDLQPRQRHAGRPAPSADRARSRPSGLRTRRRELRARRHRARDRLRRDDRRADRDRHPRPRRPDAAGQMGGRARAPISA